MKLSHIHENRIPSLAEYLNKHWIRPVFGPGSGGDVTGSVKLAMCAQNPRLFKVKIEQSSAIFPSVLVDKIVAHSDPVVISDLPIKNFEEKNITPTFGDWKRGQSGRPEAVNEPEPEPSENPLDDIEDTFQKKQHLSYTPDLARWASVDKIWVTVVEGSGEFEGQFAWYGELPENVDESAHTAGTSEYGERPSIEYADIWGWTSGNPTHFPI